MHYTVGPISDVNGMTKTVYTERPVLQMGQGTHFDVIEGGEMKAVENEDYAAMMVKFADSAQGAGAMGTLEASRVAVGPRASYAVEIYGTEGSVKWDFENMNEIQLAIGRKGLHLGYQRVMVAPGFGEFDHFQPGAGTGMSYDDLKVIEAKKFLEAFVGGQALNSNINDAVAAARVVSAAETSAESGAWVVLAVEPGTTAALRA
jgi:predicted dehydrogenase